MPGQVPKYVVLSLLGHLYSIIPNPGPLWTGAAKGTEKVQGSGIFHIPLAMRPILKEGLGPSWHRVQPQLVAQPLYCC